MAAPPSDWTAHLVEELEKEMDERLRRCKSAGCVTQSEKQFKLTQQLKAQETIRRSKLKLQGEKEYEAVVKKIENKGESAAALYCVVRRDRALRNQHSMFMDDVVGLVALIGTAPTLQLSRLLAEYLGEDQMLAIVCRSKSDIATQEKYEVELNSLAEALGTRIKGSHQFICLEDISAFTGGFVDGDYQKKLALHKPVLPDGTTPPSFLGFAVNMIHIGAKHRQTKTSAGHGLRETLFYKLFGELQVYETKEDLTEACRNGCVPYGALSLDGWIIQGNGLISLGSKDSDVHFPVIDEQEQIRETFYSTAAKQQIKEIAIQNQHPNVENEDNFSLLLDSISCFSNHSLQQRQAAFLRSVVSKEWSGTRHWIDSMKRIR